MSDDNEAYEGMETARGREVRGLAAKGPADHEKFTGYKSVEDFCDYIDANDIDIGYCCYGGMDLNDTFGAFTQRQYGVVGGDKTVDDFTPEGVEDGKGSVGGATGSKRRG